MRAVRIQRIGDPSGMVVTAIPAPVAGRGQVVIATEAIGVGGVDAVIRRGTLDGYGLTEGLIPGSEVAGRVTGVGDGVDTKWVGRRVWAFTGVSHGGQKGMDWRSPMDGRRPLRGTSRGR